ncbi:alpha,alpha-trehalose-phosphate synthase (UDP-forming) [Alkalilimnicola sp. S0819]|uniref:alpha,alpha-trehalose-phosphate synthase (UDP-forming) n=1 Tax=Alkalilimnicola sp. S0819 TaxID=2613922 RepID=UPI001261C297|nr:trehalose-6-phosphate synthase [Alkalilimnicola sp. S0819]KAB7627472.1 trehalose-6-phosphate synthase [Alkalilimnicola sp. S0819]MPQ15624.1 trehalose-6-phosphate synthase [Alkalilimnicola sp. S0819]
MPASTQGRIIVVSNRLPVTLCQQGKRWHAEPSSGGLVNAMVPVLRRHGGLWVGWPGQLGASARALRRALDQASGNGAYRYHPVSLSSAEHAGFYHGFSNEIIWPLFHDLFTRCNFDPRYWRIYERVNRKFARIVSGLACWQDFVWVHDYHLMELASALRRLSCPARLGFFLHIPFPPLEIFLKLPWRFQILRKLLAFDLIGFQTLRDRRNFGQCVHRLLHTPARAVARGTLLQVAHREEEASHPVAVGSFPIGIDAQAVRAQALSSESAQVAATLDEAFPGRCIILGVDRLDYTKGLPNKLEAFRTALHRYPRLRGRVHLVQHAVPSRHDIPAYQALRLEVERLVGEINGEFTEEGWVPIHYMFHRLSPVHLAAWYRRADIALVTPLKDGMNLVAKEYCASRVERPGVLILSEFAGAAPQLQDGALLINPYDVEGTAEAIHRAYRMPASERARRMARLWRQVSEQNVYRWAEQYLAAAAQPEPHRFPPVADYLPREPAAERFIHASLHRA